MSLQAAQIILALPCTFLAVFFFIRLVAGFKLGKWSAVGSFRGMCFCIALSCAGAGLDYYSITHGTHQTYAGRVTRLYTTHGRSESAYMDVVIETQGVKVFWPPYIGPNLVVGEHVSVTTLNNTPRVTELRVLDGPGAGLDIVRDGGLSGDVVGLYLAAFFALLGFATYFFRSKPIPANA